MSFSSGDGGGAISEINITPLVDVMLVLLIIFMVTTAAGEQQKLEEQTQTSLSKRHEEFVKLNLPVTQENDQLADPETGKLVIIIDNNLRVFLTRGLLAGSEDGARPIADCQQFRSATKTSAWKPCFDQVQKALGRTAETANKRMIDEGVYLQADAEAPYGFVAGVMARLRLLGVLKIDIVTNPSVPTPETE